MMPERVISIFFRHYWSLFQEKIDMVDEEHARFDLPVRFIWLSIFTDH
jgi:hypothetical protein